MNLNLTPEHLLAGGGVLLALLWVWRTRARRARAAADTARSGARLLSLFGRVVFTAGLIVGVQWLVITHPHTSKWLLLAVLGLPAPVRVLRAHPRVDRDHGGHAAPPWRWPPMITQKIRTGPQDERHMPLTRAQRLAQDAAEAAEVRAYQTHPDVIALRVEKVRAQVDRLCWAGIVLGLAFTMTNVQTFAAAGASSWSLPWLAAWGARSHGFVGAAGDSAR